MALDRPPVSSIAEAKVAGSCGKRSYETGQRWNGAEQPVPFRYASI